MLKAVLTFHIWLLMLFLFFYVNVLKPFWSITLSRIFQTKVTRWWLIMCYTTVFQKVFFKCAIVLFVRYFMRAQAEVYYKNANSKMFKLYLNDVLSSMEISSQVLWKCFFNCYLICLFAVHGTINLDFLRYCLRSC